MPTHPHYEREAPVGEQVVEIPFVVGVIGVETEAEPFLQPNPVTRKVVPRPLRRQPEPVLVIEVQKVRFAEEWP